MAEDEKTESTGSESTRNIPGALGVGVNGAPLAGRPGKGGVAKRVTDRALEGVGTGKDGKHNAVGAAGSIASAAAAGAAGANMAGKIGGGQVTGAVLAGAQEAFSSKNRKAVGRFVMAMVAAVAMVFVVAFSAVSGALGMSAGEDYSNRDYVSARAASDSGMDTEQMAYYREVSVSDSVPWQVVGAMHMAQTNQATASTICPAPPALTDPPEDEDEPEDPPEDGEDPPEDEDEPEDPDGPTEYAHPVTGDFRITSSFGMRTHPVGGERKLHKGMDFSAAEGTQLVAAATGTVIQAGTVSGHPGGGNQVWLRLADGTELRYLHMKSVDVSIGQEVEFNTFLGELGSSGNSTGPHLHFEVVRDGEHTDPMLWMAEVGIDPNLGNVGAPVFGPGPIGGCYHENAAGEDDDGNGSVSNQAEELDLPDYVSDYWIDTDYLLDEGLTKDQILAIDEEEDQGAAHRWVAEEFKKKLMAQDNPSLNLGDGVVAEEEPTSAEQALAERTKATFVGAMVDMPFQGMDENRAGHAYDAALAWYQGKTASLTAGGSGGVCTVGGAEFFVASSVNPVDKVLMDSKTLGYAAQAVSVAKENGVNENGQLAMLMTMLQESRMQMYANSNVPASLGLPYDKVGSDHDSTGLFQQRGAAVNWAWGPLEANMDPRRSAAAFLGVSDESSAPGLTQISGWESMLPGQLAQKVQASAHPDLYNQWEDAARETLAAVDGVECNMTLPEGARGAIIAAAESQVGLPYSWSGGGKDGPSDPGNGIYGFDCSGLTAYAYYQGAGIPSKRYTKWDYNDVKAMGNMVYEWNQLQPGDMVFFNTTSRHYANHVGIYKGIDGAGNHVFIHAKARGDFVKVETVTPGSYYDTRMVGGGTYGDIPEDSGDEPGPGEEA